MYLGLVTTFVMILGGLVWYGRRTMKATPATPPSPAVQPEAATRTKRKARWSLWPSRPESSEVLPSEEIVDVAEVYHDFLVTPSGDLVALCALQPVQVSTTHGTQSFDQTFASAIHALPSQTTLQVTQMPVPANVTPLLDRYARRAYHWQNQAQQHLARGEEGQAILAAQRNNYVAQIGATLVEQGASSSQRVALLVLSKNAAPLGAINQASLEATAQELSTQVHQLAALFEAQHLPLRQLSPQETLRLLWYAYNPAGGAATAIQQAAQRFLEIATAGQSDLPTVHSLTDEQLQRGLADPQLIPELLAPPVVEEREAFLQFEHKRLLVYFAPDFRSALPHIDRLMGERRQFADRLWVSYYLTAPAPDKVAHATLKASTSKQALQHLSERMGKLPSYRQQEEILAVEQARYGSETEKNVPRTLGLYLALLTHGEDKAMAADQAEFEAALRAAGVVFVPARWTSLRAWRSMVPLAQRHHRFEDRNIFAENMSALNPLAASAWFDPDGELCGYTPVADGQLSPVAVVRKRGSAIIPSDAVVGRPGSGKSFALKYWMIDWICRGHKVFAIDPKLEFGPVTKELGGKELPMLANGGFSIFNFDHLALDAHSKMGRELTQLGFADNLAALESLYRMAKGSGVPMSGVEKNLLINALRGALTQKGMDPKDANTWRANQVFLKDVYLELAVSLRQQDPQTVRMMVNVLEQYGAEGGQYFDLYNHPTDFDLDGDLTTMVFGLAQFSGDEMNRSLAHHYALRLAVQQAVRSFLLDEHSVPFHIIIDEASQLLTSAPLVSSVVSMLSLLPAYNVRVHLAFQDMAALRKADALVGAAQGLSVNSLQGTIPAYYFFKQELSSARLAVEGAGLSNAEAQLISGLQPGQCILAFSGIATHIPLVILVPEAFHELLATDPESMQRRLHEEYAE